MKIVGEGVRDKITREEFEKLPNGAIFSYGNGWVAVKGQGNDWACYYGTQKTGEKQTEFLTRIAKHGTKIGRRARGGKVGAVYHENIMDLYRK